MVRSMAFIPDIQFQTHNICDNTPSCQSQQQHKQPACVAFFTRPIPWYGIDIDDRRAANSEG